MAISIKRLLPTPGPSSPKTIYNLKFVTKNGSTHVCRLNFCIVNSHGDAFMLQLNPFNADFWDKHGMYVHQFVGPCEFTNDIRYVIAAPETGTWAPGELKVTSFFEDQKQEWMFNYDANVAIGERGGDLAAVLSVEKVFTPEERAEMKCKWDKEYESFKAEIMKRSVQTSMFGIVCTDLGLGHDKAVAFAVGCALSAVYMNMLVFEIDKIGTQRQLVNSATRLATVFGLAGFIIHQNHDAIIHDNSYFILGFLGFISYKLSMGVKGHEDPNDRP